MNFIKSYSLFALFIFALSFALPAAAQQQQAPAQSGYEVLAGAALTKVVPKSFYFAGQSAETQTRNTAAARVGGERYVIVGLVDTSGYSTEISGKYEGFFITDSPVAVGDAELAPGAYGFGFSADGKLNFFDLGSRPLLSVSTVSDAQMRRPRPLAMTSDAKGVRFYKGKNYVLIAAK